MVPLRVPQEYSNVCFQVVQRLSHGASRALSPLYELADRKTEFVWPDEMDAGLLCLSLVLRDEHLDDIPLPVNQLVQYTSRCYNPGAASHRGRTARNWKACGEHTLGNTVSSVGIQLCIQISHLIPSERPTLPRLPLERLSKDTIETVATEYSLLRWFLQWYRILYIAFQAFKSESACVGLLVIYSHFTELKTEFIRWTTTLEASLERSRTLIRTLPTVSAAKRYYQTAGCCTTDQTSTATSRKL